MLRSAFQNPSSLDLSDAFLFLRLEIDDKRFVEDRLENLDESLVRRMHEISVAVPGVLEAHDPAVVEALAQSFRAHVLTPLERVDFADLRLQRGKFLGDLL